MTGATILIAEISSFGLSLVRGREMHRKPRWQIEVSICCGMRAAVGNEAVSWSSARRNDVKGYSRISGARRLVPLCPRQCPFRCVQHTTIHRAL